MCLDLRTRKRDGIYKIYSYEIYKGGRADEIEYAITSKLFKDLEYEHKNGLIEYYSSQVIPYYVWLVDWPNPYLSKTEYFLITKDDSSEIITVMRYFLHELVKLLNDDLLCEFEKDYSTDLLYKNIFERETPRLCENLGREQVREALTHKKVFETTKELARKVIDGICKRIIMPLDFDLPTIMPQELARVILDNNWLDMSVFFEFMDEVKMCPKPEHLRAVMIKTMENIKKGLTYKGAPLWKIVGVKKAAIKEETAKHYLAFMCWTFNKLEKKCF